MKASEVEAVMEGLLERLASIEHERWSHWQRYVHDQGERSSNGGLVLSKDLIERWERQIATDYADLSDQEKESDREQVRRYLEVIKAALLAK